MGVSMGAVLKAFVFVSDGWWWAMIERYSLCELGAAQSYGLKNDLSVSFILCILFMTVEYDVEFYNCHHA